MLTDMACAIIKDHVMLPDIGMNWGLYGLVKISILPLCYVMMPMRLIDGNTPLLWLTENQ